MPTQNREKKSHTSFERKKERSFNSAQQRTKKKLYVIFNDQNTITVFFFNVYRLPCSPFSHRFSAGGFVSLFEHFACKHVSLSDSFCHSLSSSSSSISANIIVSALACLPLTRSLSRVPALH